jgi:hypothetical protein
LRKMGTPLTRRYMLSPGEVTERDARCVDPCQGIQMSCLLQTLLVVANGER